MKNSGTGLITREKTVDTTNASVDPRIPRENESYAYKTPDATTKTMRIISDIF